MSHATALTLRQPTALVPLTGSLDAYIASVNQVPVLDADAERALAEKLRAENDLGAAQQLVLSNLRHQVAAGDVHDVQAVALRATSCTSPAATWATACRWPT